MKTKTRRSGRNGDDLMDDITGDVAVGDGADVTIAPDGDSLGSENMAQRGVIPLAAPERPETIYQHVTAVRCPRCSSPMRANGTRIGRGSDGQAQQLKRWICSCAVCRRTHETVGVAI
jgi:hypothetical protein